MKKLTPLVFALMLSIAPATLATYQDTPPPEIIGAGDAAQATGQTSSRDQAASIATGSCGVQALYRNHSTKRVFIRGSTTEGRCDDCSE